MPEILSSLWILINEQWELLKEIISTEDTIHFLARKVFEQFVMWNTIKNKVLNNPDIYGALQCYPSLWKLWNIFVKYVSFFEFVSLFILIKTPEINYTCIYIKYRFNYVGILRFFFRSSDVSTSSTINRK